MRQKEGSISGRTYQPVVLCLHWHERSCQNPGKDPGEQGKAERGNPDLVMAALEGKPQEGLMMSRNQDMKIGIFQVDGCDQGQIWKSVDCGTATFVGGRIRL